MRRSISTLHCPRSAAKSTLCTTRMPSFTSVADLVKYRRPSICSSRLLVWQSSRSPTLAVLPPWFMFPLAMPGFTVCGAITEPIMVMMMAFSMGSSASASDSRSRRGRHVEVRSVATRRLSILAFCTRSWFCSLRRLASRLCDSCSLGSMRPVMGSYMSSSFIIMPMWGLKRPVSSSSSGVSRAMAMDRLTRATLIWVAVRWNVSCRYCRSDVYGLRLSSSGVSAPSSPPASAPASASEAAASPATAAPSAGTSTPSSSPLPSPSPEPEPAPASASLSMAIFSSDSWRLSTR
mmetsp:Transcript_8585/g.29243  ORF Transcript_8585/g.29243 Transcript_8585/m.29243 type:complete len:292 (+) Transcript_8585:1682-2557(+)